jgi:LAO/AO transport system kinase
MQRAGLRLVGDSIKTGAGGHRYFFIHPASTGGVLVEIVGSAGGPSGNGKP